VALSNRLADLGRREEALAAIEEAVTIRRQLADAHPDAHLPDLAMSLSNQSTCLAALGQREEALAAIEEAVTIRRQLADARPDAHLPDLAMSLNNQSNRLAALGRPEEALAAIEEAAGIYRQLADARPDAHLPDLATSLNNQSSRLAALGRPGEALAAIEEAVTIRRQLADARPDTFLPQLAQSLNKQFVYLTALRQWDEALAPIEQVVSIRRQLANAHPGMFRLELVRSLYDLANALFTLDRTAEASEIYHEAVGTGPVILASATSTSHRQLLALRSAADTLAVNLSLAPTGIASVGYRAVKRNAVATAEDEIGKMFDRDAEKSAQAEVTRDTYGFNWITIRQPPDQFESLVTSLHAVISKLVDFGMERSLLCALTTFRDSSQRHIAIVYICKRSTFYPFAPLPGQKRDNILELKCRDALKEKLSLEADLSKWFPIWGAPGLTR
jgi:tetratricopeptide (TPR) repeat protein